MIPTSPALPLVGRVADLSAVAEMFASDHRLVTLTGPAGVGKTRLALEVAVRSRAASDPPPAIFVDSIEVRDIAALCDAVTLALGASGGAGGEDPVGRVGRAIAARGPALVILDAIDAALDPARVAVDRWLSIAPEATFLVTSRARLGSSGEVVREIAPLSLPEGPATEGSEAVELFVLTAQRARSSFALGPAEAPFVAAIVRELDGIPLAIELAAPRMAVMGARALLHRLGDRFEILRRRGAGRHATLEAAIESSYHGLTAWELAALAQLSVFRGGFTLEAAEAVVDTSGHPAAPPVLEVVAKLRDRSLLHAHEPLPLPGEIRLALSTSVREHIARKLDPDAARAAEDRHADAVVRFAETWARESVGRGAAEARARILLERDNLLAVLTRVLARRPVTARSAEPALRALLVLAPVVADEGPLDAYLALLDPVLSATADSGADPRLYANALAVRGALARRRGQGKVGSRDLVRALSAATTLGDRRLEARVTHELGHALAARGEALLAEQHFERARELSREVGDRAGMGDAIASLAILLARTGRVSDAIPVVERALAIHRAERCDSAEAGDLRALGEMLLDLDRLDEARARVAEAKAISAAAGDRRGEALSIALAALADDLAGDLGGARAAYDRAAAMLSELGLASLEASIAGRCGVVCAREGRHAEAYARIGAAIDRLGDEPDRASSGILLCYKAALDAHVGRAAEARSALAEAERRLTEGAPFAASSLLDLARGALDPSFAAEAARRAKALAPRSAEARLALACFAALASSKGAPPPPDDALVVGPLGRWFRPPRGERIPLDHRRPLALILDRLAADPRVALSWEALLDAGWPGERVLPAAGAHRVRVALSTLRKLGLRDVLATTDDGYVISPSVAVCRVD